MARLNEPDAPRSPYKPGNGLEPPYLGDRGAQLERFGAFLADPSTPHNVVVTGLRGVGKTVLLQRYSIEAREAGWLVAVFSSLGRRSASTFNLWPSMSTVAPSRSRMPL